MDPVLSGLVLFLTWLTAFTLSYLVYEKWQRDRQFYY